MVCVLALANRPGILYRTSQTLPLQNVKGVGGYVCTICRHDQEYSRFQIPIVRQNRKPFGDQGIFVKIHGAKGPEFGTTRLPQVVPETQRTPTSLEFDPAAGLHQTLK